MSVMKPCRVRVSVLCLGLGIVLGGCSDDDTPLVNTEPTRDGGSTESTVSSFTTATSETASWSSSSDDSGPPEDVTTPGMSSDTPDSGSGVTETADAGDSAPLGLLEGLRADPDTATFAELVERAEMQEDLLKEGPFTVFAPTNDGFSRLPPGYLDSLSRKQVETLVRNHLLSEPQTMAELMTAGTMVSLLEVEFDIAEHTSQVYINGLTRVGAREKAFSGSIVHEVDSVLCVGAFPGTLADAVHAYPRLSELDEQLSEDDRSLLREDDRTLFAPVNGGFERWQAVAAASDGGAPDGGATASALSYHVLPRRVEGNLLGRGGVIRSSGGPYLGMSEAPELTINNGSYSTRVIAELPVESGDEGSVLHVVEELLVAPPSVAQVLASGTASGDMFTRFHAALNETMAPADTSFLEYVANRDEITVFAPTDVAFNRIAGSFGNALSKVVGFHVLDELVDSPRLSDGSSNLPATVSASVSNTFQVLRVDEASLLDGMVTIVTRDIPAANGVIHVVDGVLVPQDVTFPGTTIQALSAYPALSRASDAVTQSGLLVGVTSTLFAPFDSAFGEGLTASAFIDSHALSPGVRDRATFGIQFTSLGGSTIDVDAETLTVDGVNIVRPDVLTQSGVIHITDGLLGRVNADADAGP